MYQRLNGRQDIMAALQVHKQKVLFIFVFLTVVLFYWLSTTNGNSPVNYSNFDNSNSKELNNINKKWILENCLKKNFNEMSLEFLSEYIEKFRSSGLKECISIGQAFDSMFELSEVVSEVRLTPEFRKRVSGWLDNNPEYLKQAYHQKVIRLYNKFNNEEMIFNPLRGKRPIKKPEISDKDFSLDMIEKSQSTCDFCNNYTKNTADDVFDKIETPLSYTSANTFKYDKWHSLILSRKHNPLTLTQEDILDMFNIAIQWFKKVYKLDKTAQCPAILWDVMPKSGASQVHPHFQLSISSKNYGGIRRWLDASKHYYNKIGRNFFEDFILIHKGLGLVHRNKNAYVIANLIPIKEQEFYFIAENSESGYLNLATLLHQTIKTMVEYENYAWSMGMYIPKYDGDENNFFTKKSENENQGTLNRIILRIVFRTPAAAQRSDYNGLDMYTSSVLGIDRYKVASKLFSKLETL